MGQRRKNDGVLSRTIGKERVGELVTCKWIYGICMITDYESRAFYSIFEVYHFDTHEKYWVDEDEVEKL